MNKTTLDKRTAMVHDFMSDSPVASQIPRLDIIYHNLTIWSDMKYVEIFVKARASRTTKSSRVGGLKRPFTTIADALRKRPLWSRHTALQLHVVPSSVRSQHAHWSWNMFQVAESSVKAGSLAALPVCFLAPQWYEDLSNKLDELLCGLRALKNILVNSLSSCYPHGP